ncbi:GGDEF domain-containing protein [Wenzhouxiangella marina]|uniref:GGDEF domain-containing protein n=1 Tax=Wenzhouxiangella marina TaxID=1579979 RepID=UPI0014700D2D|nr:GGDEF domain-containing protein [Wenzhouxiangella marina]MBB6087416.1 diguanylate cyclase (GGDEF)-like protein [Wenzhouxiangella marina]
MIIAILVTLLGVTGTLAAPWARASQGDFEARLNEAAELNITAPWRESQAVLDELRPRLAEATIEQRARFELIEARNLILAGDFEAGLARIDQLLEQPIPTAQVLRARTLGANAAIVSRRYNRGFELLNAALAMPGLEQYEQLASELLSLASYAYALVGQPELGLEYGYRAIDLAREHDTERGLCVVQQRMGFNNKIIGRYEQARHHYESGLEACEDTNDELVSGIIQYSLADLLRLDGDLEGARALFEQALPRMEATGFPNGIAEARLYWARLENELGNDEKVTELVTPALSAFTESQAWDYLAEAHQLLGEVAIRAGRHAEALEHFEARLAANQEFQDLDRNRRLAYLEVEFDTRFKEQEIELLREQTRVAQLEAETQRQNARLRWISVIFGLLLILALALWLARALRERRHFHRLSQTDGLTELYNHTRFFELLEEAAARVRRDGKELSIVLADIDHFKQVNDRFGHLVGDEVLRHTSRVLKEVFGPSALIGRIGGEEFAIALPDAGLSEAAERVEQLRKRLAGADRRRTDPPVTLSFGLARLETGESPEEMRIRADEALYRAKNSGRNRAEFAQST